jgi:hypothetical protein
MIKLTSILVLLSVACFCNAVNPGLVAVITLPIINKVKDKYFETIFQNFGHQVIPEVKSGDIKISNIIADLSNGSPDNLKVTFDAGSNSIRVDIEQTAMNVHVDWHYSKSIISESGDATIKGTLDGIGMNIAMTSLVDGQFTIPQIDVQNFALNFNRDNFGLDFHCNNCPGFIEDLIKDFLKDTLLDTVRDQIASQVPSQLLSGGNKALLESYPRTVNPYANFGIATALTDKILVSDNHLEIPLDATVFRSDQAFSRPGDAGVMPHYNPADAGEIMLFIDNYLLSTLKDVVDVEGFTYKTTILAMDYELTIPAVTGLSYLAFEEGDFVVTASPSIVATAYNVGLELSATAKLNPTISPGDATNMFYVTPTIKSISINSLVVVISGEKYDISGVAGYLNGVIQGMLNQFVIPVLSVPKQTVLPLQVTKNVLDFHSGNAEFGVLFEFKKQ